jgi:hypothetical protein
VPASTALAPSHVEALNATVESAASAPTAANVMIRFVVMMSALQTGLAHPTSAGGSDQREMTALRDRFMMISSGSWGRIVVTRLSDHDPWIRPPRRERCGHVRADAVRSGHHGMALVQGEKE